MHVVSCEFYKIFRTTFFYRTPPVAASGSGLKIDKLSPRLRSFPRHATKSSKNHVTNPRASFPGKEAVVAHRNLQQPWESAVAFGNAVVNAVLVGFTTAKKMPL